MTKGTIVELAFIDPKGPRPMIWVDTTDTDDALRLARRYVAVQIGCNKEQIDAFVLNENTAKPIDGIHIYQDQITEREA